MADELVLFERRERVALITLNRPEYRNAQNAALLYALDDAFAAAAGDNDIRTIVLAGAGDHFSAGHDIGSPGRDVNRSYPRRATLQPDHLERPDTEARWIRESEVYVGLCRRWRQLPKPTIAMVQGGCVAAGLMLAWTCDLIVAADDAFFSDPTLRMGVPGVEWFAHPWAFGPRLAKEILFTGGRISAQRAHEAGMVCRVVPRSDLERETLELAGRIAEMPPFALGLAKQAVNQAEDLMGLQTGIDAAFGLHQLGHAHASEAVGDYIGGMDPRTMRDLSEGA